MVADGVRVADADVDRHVDADVVRGVGGVGRGVRGGPGVEEAVERGLRYVVEPQSLRTALDRDPDPCRQVVDLLPAERGGDLPVDGRSAEGLDVGHLEQLLVFGEEDPRPEMLVVLWRFVIELYDTPDLLYGSDPCSGPTFVVGSGRNHLGVGMGRAQRGGEQYGDNQQSDSA